MPTRPRLTPEVADARRAVRESFQSAALKAGSKLVVAVSGGSDSLALAAAVAFEAPRHGLLAHAVIINHQLQSNSDEVGARAAKSCEEFGLSAEVRTVSVPKTKSGLEADARSARYQELESARVAIGASFILLGHTLDDQAETVLLGLVRGSGLRSIAGMPAIDQDRKLVRPFLALTKAQLRKSLGDLGVSFWEDPHNSDAAFTRVRIRELLAAAESELGPGLPKALARTAEIASRAEDFLEQSALAIEPELRTKTLARALHYDAKRLELVHPALLRELVHLVAQRAGAKNLSHTQLEAVSELVENWHGQKSISLSGITVERKENELIFKPKPPTLGAC